MRGVTYLLGYRLARIHMACPFFKPARRLDAGGWDPPPRLPLGDAWAGECTAGCGEQPVESTQREVCNCGYARGRRAGGLAMRGGGGACGRAGSAAAHRVRSSFAIRRTATSEILIP